MVERMEGYMQGEPEQCKGMPRFVEVRVIFSKEKYLKLKKELENNTVVFEAKKHTKEEAVEFERQYKEYCKEQEAVDKKYCKEKVAKGK